jgi:serine protease inhibitor
MKEQGEKNFVFSPFSMHSVLAMLTSGATDNSTTQKELLSGFGRAQKIENLEQLYGQFLKSYKGKHFIRSTEFDENLLQLS